jgi:crossover junction endodeoxyribonuclease RuvC
MFNVKAHDQQINYKPTEVVLGIDPGSRFLGYGVVARSSGLQGWQHLASGVITLPANEALPARLAKLSLELAKTLQQFQPNLAVVEKVFLGKNVASAFVLGHARGVVFSELGKCGITVQEYATREVKKGIAGHGAADKKQLQVFLKQLLKVDHFVRDDASDALALALYGARVWDRCKVLGQQDVGV